MLYFYVLELFPIRRPLTIPNQPVRNVSPAPYGGQYEAYQSAPWQQQQSSFSPASSNYASLASSAPPAASAFSPRVADLSHQENYNRAARGWGQSRDYYRPISFTKQVTQQVELPYSDF